MSGLPDIQQNNERILNDIQSLQKIEQELFSSLEQNPKMPYDEQKKIVNKMNELLNTLVIPNQNLQIPN